MVLCCWVMIEEVIHSGPRLAEAVFSWGQVVQSDEVKKADDDSGSGQGGYGDGPRQGKQRATG